MAVKKAMSLRKKREEARKLYLAGEMATNAEIAALLRVKPHTVASWKKDEDWDELRRKTERRAAELFVEKIANDRLALNLRHYRMWEIILSSLMEQLKTNRAMSVEEIVRVSGVLDKAQKGQRLAKGMTFPGETEEALRAKREADLRNQFDVVMEAIKENVPDEEVRDRIRRSLVEALPTEDDVDTEEVYE